MGGSRIAVRTAQYVPDYMQVKIVDNDINRCNRLTELLDDKTMIINGDGRDMDEGEAVTVIRSKLELSVLSFSSSSSIRMMSCFSRESNLAKWVPTAPAPAIIIFIVIANCGSIAYWGIKNG